MNNLKLNGRTIAIGVVVLLAIFLIGSQLLNRGGEEDNVINAPSNNAVEQGENIELGRLVSSSGIDRDGCPVDSQSTFSPSDEVFVVATDSNIPAGTDVFARLFREDQPVEDSVVITADQDYDDTCIYLAFEATSGAEVLDRGDYEAQLIVNGNPGPTVSFQVQ
jgi:hypothetical protein